MDDKHPNPIDPQPKRRKGIDNPYTIFSIGIQTAHPKYFLKFCDANSVCHCIEIDKVLFDTLDQFELDDISYMNEVDRHYEQSEQTETLLSRRAVRQEESVEETVFRQMEVKALRRAISQLPQTQRRRLALYYFGNFTYKEIAEKEGCTIMPVKRSIDAALKKLREILT